MKITPPESIRKYVEDESSVPLIPFKGSLWYHITEEEKSDLVGFVAALDAIPPENFEALPDAEKWELASMLNNAERIVRNSIIKEYRIKKIGFSYEVQRYSARNYDGYYCRDWHTVATFWSEEEAQAYIKIVEGRN